jgi:NAD-dependent deacetylase
VQKLKNLACESARFYKNRQNGRVPFESLKQAVEHAQQIVATSSKITVLTGAGISTDSGIPDFRGPNGLWTKNPDSERAATLAFYLQDEELRQRSWQNRLKWINNNPQPNDGHRALIALERRNALLAIVTQNVDELHQRAGHDPEKVFEVHGTLHRTCCWGCKDRRPMTEALARVQAGDVDPKCELCGGILKSDTILFGQSLDQVVMQKAMQVSSECDVFLAIGTSLSVFPACNTLPRAKSCGAKIVIVNGQPTEMDMYADAIVNAPIAEVLPQICGVVKS